MNSSCYSIAHHGFQKVAAQHLVSPFWQDAQENFFLATFGKIAVCCYSGGNLDTVNSSGNTMTSVMNRKNHETFTDSLRALTAQ